MSEPAGTDTPFEELQQELEAIVARLEQGDVPVDEAVALWRRGDELFRACVARLDAADLQVEELLSRDDNAGGDL